MSEQYSYHLRHNPSQDALAALELFCTTAKITFDRTAAARVLYEAERAVPGDDWSSWSRRLVEVGESLHLRVRSIESSLDDALTFVRHGIPVVTCVQDAEGHLRWFLLAEARGQRLRLVSSDESQADSWISRSALRSKLGLTGKNSECRWIIGQAALSCEPPRHNDEGDQHAEPHHLAPLARLVGLLRPEKQDLWVILVFSILVGLLALASPVAVEALVNTVAFGRYLQPVVILAILLFTFLAFAGAMRALITFLVEVMQRRLFIRVVEDLAYRLPRVRQQAFDQAHGPELVNRFFDVVTLQKSITALLLDGISIVLQTVIGMAVIAFYHPFLLGFDVVLLLLIAFIILGLGRGAVRTAIKESKAKYAVAAWLEELTNHPTAFKLHAGAQFALERADQLAINWLNARRSHFRIVMRQILFALGVQALAATALLGLGGWLVLLGELTLGQLVAAELIVMIIVGSFAKLGKHMESFYDLLASVDKLGHLFDLPIEPHDKLFHLRDTVPATVSVRDVDYSYGSLKVIDDLSFQLRAGETVAVVGPSASGKSTLVDLISGLRPPNSGHVELDGIDLRELRPDSLREHLAVARGIEIFHGSIDENVRLSRPQISALDVRESLSAVGVLDDLLRLPEGLNTQLQTDGAPLTTSQATRLMLARAIIARPRLLLIDGTLDALPDDTLQTVLHNLTRGNLPWTLLVTTGRRNVIEACNRVIHLGAGVAANRAVQAKCSD